ncbi:transposase [Prosthecobacter sp.]|uniref:transposase n=1 Tax=Prosthecobacter sp. TaxID=1965333 RepID=UPI003783129F
MSFQFFDPLAGVTVTRGHLPHWDQAGATYFITWRMADSIPKAVWERWRAERDGWLVEHGIDPQRKDWRLQVEELDETERLDFRQFTTRLESEADACHGACVLRQPNLRQILMDALRCFDGQRYMLGDFVVMPNHVHLLVGGMAREAMLAQVESWKRWTARQINAALRQRGRFWQDESFDHLVRNEAAFMKFRRYIGENPGKAGLAEGEFTLWRREQ